MGFFNYSGKIDIDIDQLQRPNEGNTSSVDRYVLKKSPDLMTFIEKSLHTYLMSTICPKNDVRLRITQSWLNWTKPGQYHHKHAHPNSLISGCYYVKANKETDKIFFYRDGYQQIKFPPIAWNAYNSESWWYSIGTNDLIFFPSHLNHMVQPVGGEDTRISLAFNTFPIGHIGDESELTALYLGK